MNTFLAFDTETGGKTHETSLLEAYFMVLDEEFNFIDELHLLVQPNDGNFVVISEALAINKIDLVEHAKNAMSYRLAEGELFEFLKTYTNDFEIKLTPLGHNVDFDIGFINAHLMAKMHWDRFVSYGAEDTSIVGRYLKRVGKIPSDVRMSLKGLSEYFGITSDESFHRAKGDTVRTVMVYKAMVELLKGQLNG